MSMASRTSSPGVHFPPPFLYGAGLLVGWLLDRWRPLPITPGPSTVRDVIAAVLFAFWLGMMVSALLTFYRARTAVMPNRPAATLVTRGPYRLTRNPMYVSLVALYAALALVLNSWWLLLLLPLVVLAVDRIVIAREERYLSAAFPDAYAAYRARVRRWL